jgi:hypothetical protein
VEQSLPRIDSPWRTATLVAAAVALVELVMLIVLAVTLLADPVSEHVRKAAEAKAFAPVASKPSNAPVPAAQPRLSRAETSVIVLNGNGRAGAAAAGADRARAFGYTIGAVGNAPRRDVTRTIVMYRRGYRPEAVRLAKDLRVKIVGPLDGLTSRDMLGAHLALVLGE